MSEEAAVEALEYRAPGRGTDVVTYAVLRGLVRRTQHADESVTLEVVGSPRSMAA
jgi:hypothetical protein